MVLLSAYFISNIYQKWTATPVIIAQNAHATSISEFPFPAVTICNLNQIQKSKIVGVKKGTIESMLVKSICRSTDDDDIVENYQGKWSQFRDFLINVILGSYVVIAPTFFCNSLPIGCVGITAVFRNACFM